VMFLVAVMSAILCVEMRLVAFFVEWAVPAKLPRGEFPWALTAQYLAEMWGAGLFMTMIELWVALAFRSFVAPLVLGLSGTFFAVAAFGAKETVFMPWVMPVSIIARDGSSATLALTLGIGGGIVTCVLMMLHLSRREI
jgi:lantibiotic transport system permease protein